MNWQIGDVAICITPGSRMEGKEVVILSIPFSMSDKPDLVHMVDPGMSSGNHIGWAAERRHLVPLPDPNMPSTWEECVFKPQELLIVG